MSISLRTMKLCVMGNHEAPLSEFGKNKTTPDGLTCSCLYHRREKYRGQYKKQAKKRLAAKQREKFQIAAFLAMYKASRIGGVDRYNAFASAICGSCDDAFDKLPEGSVERYFKYKQGNKQARAEIK